MDEHPFDVLASPVRRRIVDLLANREPRGAALTAAELGAEIALHPTTARFHLDQLETAGLVEAVFERRGVGRPRKVYRIPQEPMKADDRHAPLAELSALLTDAWDRPAGATALTPEEAGRQWALRAAGRTDGDAEPLPDTATSPGQWLGKVGVTLDLLHRWGYSPELRTADGGRTAQLTLLDCPFLELARAHPGVVCGVHRGLLRGALEAVGEADTHIGLRPLVAPGRCEATITTRAAFT